MKRHVRRSISCGAALAVALMLFAACGGEESVASKSAAAYREAQAKGVPVGGGHDHGGHEAAAATVTNAVVDHSAHGAMGTVADPHAGHDMGGGGADHGGHRATPAASGHAGHAAAPTATAHAGHAGMQHGTATPGADPHAGHRQAPATAQADHSQHGSTAAARQQPAAADPHAQHRTGSTAGTSTPVAASPRMNAETRNVQPWTTLQPDAFDAPAPASVSESQKTVQGGHEGHQVESPQAKPDGAVVYTCPMHPEVTSDKPGTCPKCGMALVKKR